MDIEATAEGLDKTHIVNAFDVDPIHPGIFKAYQGFLRGNIKDFRKVLALILNEVDVGSKSLGRSEVDGGAWWKPQFLCARAIKNFWAFSS